MLNGPRFLLWLRRVSLRFCRLIRGLLLNHYQENGYIGFSYTYPRIFLQISIGFSYKIPILGFRGLLGFSVVFKFICSMVSNRKVFQNQRILRGRRCC